MKQHRIRTKPEYFAAVARGFHYLDVAIPDLPERYEFAAGDAVLLEEWFPSAETGTGELLHRDVVEIYPVGPGCLRLIFTTATSPKGP